ncbi:MAG: ester cyclase [Thermoplasmata archaeon]
MKNWEELSDGFLAALQAQDENKAVEYLTDDVNYWEANMQEPIHGVEAVKDHFRQNWGSFTETQFKVVNRIVSGDWGTDEGEWTGTNTGPIETPDQTIPATGKQARLAWVAVGKRSGDKLSELRVYYDNVSVFAQLGIMPGSESD